MTKLTYRATDLEPQSLRDLVAWFRAEWQAEIAAGRIHVRDIDAGGAPEWNVRFRDLVNFRDVDMDVADLKRMQLYPMRWHLRSMARDGKHSYRRARFLFILACQGFRVTDAARIVSPAGYDEHGEQWALDYAAMCILRLFHRYRDPATTHDDGQPRSFVDRRIHKSEAQSSAEAA